MAMVPTPGRHLTEQDDAGPSARKQLPAGGKFQTPYKQAPHLHKSGTACAAGAFTAAACNVALLWFW